MDNEQITALSPDEQAVQRVADIVTVALRQNGFVADVEVNWEPRSGSPSEVSFPGMGASISATVDGGVIVSVGLHVTP